MRNLLVQALSLLGLIGLSFSYPASADAHSVSPGNIVDSDVRNSVSDDRLQKVTGCHAGHRTHFVPRWGYVGKHRHKGPRCWPMEKGRGCHRNFRQHYHGTLGGGGWHRHTGASCIPTRGQQFYNPPGSGGCFKAGPVWICP